MFRKPNILCCLFVLLFLFLSLGAYTQKVFYSDLSRPIIAGETMFVTGKQHDTIVVWMFNVRTENLEVDFFDNEMNLLSKYSLRIPRIIRMCSIALSRKNDCNSVIVQYQKEGYITRQYFFDKPAKQIEEGPILENTDYFSDLVIKYSADNAYTAFIKGFTTEGDSRLFIHYVLYNSNNEAVYQNDFMLPQHHDFLNLYDCF